MNPSAKKERKFKFEAQSSFKDLNVEQQSMIIQATVEKENEMSCILMGWIKCNMLKQHYIFSISFIQGV